MGTPAMSASSALRRDLPAFCAGWRTGVCPMLAWGAVSGGMPEAGIYCPCCGCACAVACAPLRGATEA